MLTCILSAAIFGLEGVLIEVEVDVASRGFPIFTIVGLPDKAIGEAKDRVRTAIINAGYEMPDSRITVNLAPADIPKVGSSFDLPIALGILASCGVIKEESLKGCLFVGELSLEGNIRPVHGAISIALLTKQKNTSCLYMPEVNSREVTFIDGLAVYPLRTLNDLILHLNGVNKIPKQEITAPIGSRGQDVEVDFGEIAGQYFAKRALEIAAAGMHNIHLKGPPGTGKTMLSRAFSSILPPLSFDEMIEVSRIYSAVGLLNEALLGERPFRAPHHTTSRNGLIGGGSHPIPGEISLAHRGVLFLDELPEFQRSTLEALRQPLEDGIITISRAAGSVTFPCRFLLLASSNPCPCGYLGHPKKYCHCMSGTISLYKRKLSGPLLDRIDLHVDVLPVEDEQLVTIQKRDLSFDIRKRVIAAHERQRQRFKNTTILTNSQLTSSQVRSLCHIDDAASQLLKQAIAKYSLSARSYFKIIKVAQTIADLSIQDRILPEHISEALHYRTPGY